MPTGKVSIDKVLHALSDPTRREILEMLSDKTYSVSRLAEPFGMTLTAVMQHLQILENSGLVRTEKVGRVRTASLVTGGFDPLEEWIGQRRSNWEIRLDRLQEILREMKEGGRK